MCRRSRGTAAAGSARWLRPVHVVVRGHHTDDPVGAVAEVEHERDVERDEVAEPGRIEPTRRVREADLARGAGHVRPPRVDGPVGEPEVGGQVAEQVEGQRRRPQEFRPQALVIEALVRFDGGRARPRRVACGGGEEGRAGVARVLEREATPGRTGRRAFTRDDRLRADRVPVRLAPLRLVVAQPPTEVGHLGPPRHAVDLLPAVRGFEVFPGRCVSHGLRGTRGRVARAA
jgi:hypothetical protein